MILHTQVPRYPLAAMGPNWRTSLIPNALPVHSKEGNESDRTPATFVVTSVACFWLGMFGAEASRDGSFPRNVLHHMKRS